MEKRSFLLLKMLVLVVIAESAVIVPRKLNNNQFENEDIADKELEPNSGIGIPGRGSYDSSGTEYDDRGVNNPRGQPSDYDYNRPDENDADKPGIKPKIIPDYEDETIDKRDESSKPGDEDNFEPFDGEEDSGEAEGHEEEDLKPSTDENDEKVPKENSDDEKVTSEEEGGKGKKPDEEGDEKPSDEHDDNDKKSDEKGDGKHSHEHDDNNKKPYDDNHAVKDLGHVFGSSIFDTPFFNLNKVRKYFSQMERALGHVFHQVLEEARLLNGTYANTTEEEVDIFGKKYVVHKSVIKGGDNHSSIYVETLSTKPKLDGAKRVERVKRKNYTKE